MLAMPWPARADWAVFGAGYYCDNDKREFAIQAMFETSDPGPRDLVADDARVQKLTYGEHSLSCVVNGRSITARIDLYPPSGGECMGAGYVALRSLVVNGITVLANERFNFVCRPDDEILFRISVRPQARVLGVTICRAKKWGWKRGYEGIECNAPLTVGPTGAAGQRQVR